MIETVLIYLPLTTAIGLAIRYFWHADRTITRLNFLLDEFPLHRHDPGGLIAYPRSERAR